MFGGRKICYIVMAVVIASLIFSGCVSETPEVTPTVSPTVSPTISPVVTPTPAPMPEGVNVQVLKAPDTGSAGVSFEVIWRVNSPAGKNIPHTAVHYGPDPKAEPLTLTSYPSLTTPQSGAIPANFSANIVINATGITYFRAHAIVDGVNFWSEERMINISASMNATAGTTPATTTTPRGSGY